MRTRPPHRALAALALLASLAPRAAHGGGPVPAQPNARVIEETALVVWDSRSKIEHLFVAARLLAEPKPGSYLLALPAAAPALQAPVPGVVEGFARLSREARPLGFSEPGSARLADFEAGASPCAALSIPCGKAASGWAEEARSAGKTLAAIALRPGTSPGEASAPYAHFTFETPSPVAPFSEPPEAASHLDLDPPAPSKEHPPRVKIWVELGAETRTGAWERAMDAAVEAESEPLAGCYAKLLEKSPRLAGDLHVQLRLALDGRASSEGERASSKAVGKIADCFAPLLEQAAWPRPAGRAAHLEVHALLRPPLAVPRVARIFLLTTLDAEAHMGSADDPRVPPDARAAASFEPTPRELTLAFDLETRLALGLDPSRRWRVLVVESLADAHGPGDEVVFRAVADLPPPKPGEAPLPIVERGDRPAAGPPDRRPSRLHGRRARAALLAVLLLGGLAVWLAAREPPAPGLPRRR